MKIFVSYTAPFKHRVEDRFTNISGHGYFEVAAFTEDELMRVERYIGAATAQQMEQQELVPAGPVVFGSVVKLEDSVASEDSAIIT